jgi:hypothetical protein
LALYFLDDQRYKIKMALKKRGPQKGTINFLTSKKGGFDEEPFFCCNTSTQKKVALKRAFFKRA